MLLAQLSDLGFNKQCVFSAIEAHGYTSLDTLVSLLMEGKNECLSDVTDTLSSYEDFSDRDESSVTEECHENVSFVLISPGLGKFVYKSFIRVNVLYILYSIKCITQ
jgi:hypothetical protein